MAIITTENKRPFVEPMAFPRLKAPEVGHCRTMHGSVLYCTVVKCSVVKGSLMQCNVVYREECGRVHFGLVWGMSI